MNSLYWRGEKQKTKIGITTASTSIHQLKYDLNQPLNLLEQHAINNTHMPKTKQFHFKIPTMTSTSTAPISTDAKQENVSVEIHLGGTAESHCIP